MRTAHVCGTGLFAPPAGEDCAEPLAFIARLAALVPPPKRHLARYFGVLGSVVVGYPASANSPPWKSKLVPPVRIAVMFWVPRRLDGKARRERIAEAM